MFLIFIKDLHSVSANESPDDNDPNRVYLESISKQTKPLNKFSAMNNLKSMLKTRKINLGNGNVLVDISVDESGSGENSSGDGENSNENNAKKDVLNGTEPDNFNNSRPHIEETYPNTENNKCPPAKNNKSPNTANNSQYKPHDEKLEKDKYDFEDSVSSSYSEYESIEDDLYTHEYVMVNTNDQYVYVNEDKQFMIGILGAEMIYDSSIIDDI